MSRRGWIAWSLLVLAGVVLIALPDDDVRLFDISRGHGPSLVDGVGILLILVAWMLLLGSVWRRRSRLPRSAAWRARVGASLLAGAALTAWSVLGDHGSWWMLGAALLGAPQVMAAMEVSGPA